VEVKYNMYAVIETGGKQYRVSQGDVIRVEKLKVEAGAKMEFDKVLVVGNSGDVQVGTPYLDAAKVVGNVVEHGKGEKVIIFKYKAKKDYRKKQGHRQPYTMVQIDSISADGSTTPKKATAKKEEAAAEVVEDVEVVKKTDEPALEKAAAEDKPVAEKKPARKPTEKKAATEDKPEDEKKPAAKKAAAEDKPEAEKKPARKPAAKKAETEDKPEVEKKPARKPAAKKE